MMSDEALRSRILRVAPAYPHAGGVEKEANMVMVAAQSGPYNSALITRAIRYLAYGTSVVLLFYFGGIFAMYILGGIGSLGYYI